MGDVRPTASYTLRVNGFERPVTDAWIGESLLYVLRERLGLAGAKDGCEQGECGACSVQVDGQLVAGCLVPAALAADSEIATVEGLSGPDGASDVQQALADSGAVQCGYCTPGLAMAVHDLLQRNHRPSEVEARQALCGNLCRCTGYRGVLAAVQSVAEAREAELEAELAAAEDAARAAAPTAADGDARAAAPATGTDQDALAAAVATAQSAADLPLAGELPLYADAELWHEAEVPAPPTAAAVGGVVPDEVLAGLSGPGATTTHQTGVYEPAGGPGYAPYPGYDDAAAGYDTGTFHTLPPQGVPGQGVPAQGIPSQGAPAHGVPAQAEGYDTGTFQVPYQGGYPAHGHQGGYDPAGYETAGYQGGGYEATPAHGTAHDGHPHDGTPAHGTPYIPTPPHGTAAGHGSVYEDGTAYGTPGYDPQHGGPGVPYGYDGATPAHGIRLPEDENA
ncbi:2Fe-2S iron-sulfur cluster-binding protein [Kitasatospora terrestris]|uniref:2Fe-2S ferredoxin-type domain-containing protein n=1 Tax=Kitasatospora terrestris TaxID=258051 RepID=A0ABP9DP75_9ACTN